VEIVLKINSKCAKTKQNEPEGRRASKSRTKKTFFWLAGKEFSPLSSLFSDAALASAGLLDGKGRKWDWMPPQTS